MRPTARADHPRTRTPARTAAHRRAAASHRAGPRSATAARRTTGALAGTRRVLASLAAVSVTTADDAPTRTRQALAGAALLALAGAGGLALSRTARRAQP